MLPNNIDVFVVVGTTGLGYNKSTWLSAAYSTAEGAEKARKFLQREADKIDDARDVLDQMNAINNLKLFDPIAWYDENILYTVDKVKHVV